MARSVSKAAFVVMLEVSAESVSYAENVEFRRDLFMCLSKSQMPELVMRVLEHHFAEGLQNDRASLLMEGIRFHIENSMRKLKRQVRVVYFL